MMPKMKNTISGPRTASGSGNVDFVEIPVIANLLR